MLIQELDAEIERLGKVILQACGCRPQVEVVVAARMRKSERADVVSCSEAVSLKRTEDVIGLSSVTRLRRFDMARPALKKNPGGRAAGAYCSSSTSIKRSRQEVLVDTRGDRKDVLVSDPRSTGSADLV